MAKTGRPPKYGRDHINERNAWKQRIANGERPPCSRCDDPLEPEDAATFHLDHDDDGINYLGPAHGFCNLSAAGQKAQRLRAARKTRPRRPHSQHW